LSLNKEETKVVAVNIKIKLTKSGARGQLTLRISNHHLYVIHAREVCGIRHKLNRGNGSA